MISPGKRTGKGRTAPTLADVPTRGRTRPRLATPAVGDGSHGPAVARWAKRHMPNPPMPWNRTAWDLILATRGGRLANRHALVSVARQNSKTTAMEALVGWWALDGPTVFGSGPQTIGWLSHDLRLTEQVFVFLHRLLEHRIVAKSFSFGRQRLEFDNGSRVFAQSNSVGAGHGFSFDLCVVDEAWRVSTAAINHGVIPAMRARPQPLIVMASTAGDYESYLLRQWREDALASIEASSRSSTAFCEWSPPPAADVNDPKWWAWANPCLGTTLTAETLLAEYQGPDRSAFLRGSLNVWVTSAASWLVPGQWERCHHPRFPELTGGVVACELNWDGDRFVAVRAQWRNGVAYVAPLVVTAYEDEMWTAVAAVYGDIDKLAIGASLHSHLPAEMARKHTLVDANQLRRWVPLVRSMIAAGQVAHPGSPVLDEHVNRAVAHPNRGLSAEGSNGAIDLARCLVWAVNLVSRPSTPRRPAVAAATIPSERTAVPSRR